MWNALWVLLAVLAVWAFFGCMRSWSTSRKRAKDVYVCRDCNEHHCSCSKEE